MNQQVTGKPSIDKPWMKYYPPQLIQGLTIPAQTVYEYLMERCPGDDVVAIHYYGRDIRWRELKEQVDLAARSLRAIGFGEGDQIPIFLRAVPEFIYLLLAAEKIGASVLCRDNTLEENIEAVKKSGAKMIIAHDFLSHEELNRYRKEAGIRGVVLLSPIRSAMRTGLPDYCWNYLESLYTDYPAYCTRCPGRLLWQSEISLQGKWRHRKILTDRYSGLIQAAPRFLSKQVIHSAHTMIGNMHQMNFYGASSEFRPTWMVTQLTPSLVAVVVAMLLMPLASDKLLILSPFVASEDVDLEMMHYRPNCWPLIPMFIETVMRNGRVPDDYDMSHLFSAGAGCEAYNNNQLKRAQKFLEDHQCKARFTTGYGCSEAGSNMSLPLTAHPIKDGNVGIPMPLTTISIFKPGTDEELTYNTMGEICQCEPGTMVGYDDPAATARTIKIHSDGSRWLHTGDIGYMTEDGTIYALTRGEAPRYGGGSLATLPMENLLADAEVEGIDDEFFVIVPDPEHHRCFVPYLFVVLNKGYTVDDIREKVKESLEEYMQPVDIIALPERPFFHFKTNRIGLTRDIEAGKFNS
ncbi:MAG: class I adenylate-forming enzyme family protein [Dorea sp.]